MRVSSFLLFAATAVSVIAQPPIASNPVIEIEGAVQKVHLAQGKGMPYLDVQTDGEMVKVYLGSMRYLMEQDFNPTAGMKVVVKGYRSGEEVVAISVTIPSEKKTLKLRDDQGRPIWRGGRWSERRTGK